MSERLDLLRRDRTLREAAWRVVRQDIGLLRGDLDSRGVGERLADRAKDKALLAAEDAAELALRHKGLVAAGVAALALWLGRNRIAMLVRRALGRDQEQAEAEEPVDDVEEECAT